MTHEPAPLRRDLALLLGWTAIQGVLVLPVFKAGVLADNDFVAHAAYAEHLVRDFAPATGTHLGWTSMFNTGQPFLLFNTPPLTYVLAAAASALGIDTVVSLKLWVTVAFLSIPWLGYALARAALNDRPDRREAPIGAALCLGLFSSELWGLDFFFNNGMINAALAIPMMLATLNALYRSLDRSFRASFAWTVLGAVAFAATILTHVTTAYMTGLFAGCILLFQRRDRWLESTVRTVGLFALGLGLTAYWLIPSLEVSEHVPAAHTWIRSPWKTLAAVGTGKIFSSYNSGFFTRHFGTSFVGAIALGLGLLGAVDGLRGRVRAAGPFAAMAALTLWIALGPAVAGPLAGLPLYDRLLWYRFITPFILAWMFLAGFGVHAAVALLRRAGPPARWIGSAALGAGWAWALAVLVSRSEHIRTEAHYPQERDALAQVATWLRDHGDRRGRVYSEFPHWNVKDAISVNYARHLLPLRSGFDELVGWVYENHAVGQVLMARGLVWDNPRPILDLYSVYDVKYAVARSGQFAEMLRDDPRWRSVVSAPPFELFEAHAFTATPVAGPTRDFPAHIVERGMLPGGEYRLRIQIDAPETAPEWAIKVNASPYWTATLDGVPVATSVDAYGRLQVPQPLAAGPHTLDLVWSMAPERRRGVLLSAAAVISTVLLGFAVRRVQRERLIAYTPPRYAGVAVVAVAMVAASARAARVDSSVLNFGYRDGMVASANPATVRVGTADDDEPSHPNRVIAAAWSEPTLHDGTPVRSTAADGQPALAVTVAPGFPATIRFRTVEPQPFAVQVVDAAGTVRCRVEVPVSGVAPIPAACIPPADGARPGSTVALGFLGDTPLTVAEATVETPIRYVEGESLLNGLDDGGTDAFYTTGLPFLRPHNGAMLSARVTAHDGPIRFSRTIADLSPGTYRIWALVTGTASGAGRAPLEVQAARKTTAILDGRADTGAPMALTWKPAGTTPVVGPLPLAFSVRARGAKAEWADLDLIALVPER